VQGVVRIVGRPRSAEGNGFAHVTSGQQVESGKHLKWGDMPRAHLGRHLGSHAQGRTEDRAHRRLIDPAASQHLRQGHLGPFDGRGLPASGQHGLPTHLCGSGPQTPVPQEGVELIARQPRGLRYAGEVDERGERIA
jgi:hypothetical protein